MDMSLSLEAKGNRLTMNRLTCFLCQKIFVEPMLLSCGHTFCLKCVEKCLRKCTNCPMCRTTTLQPIHNIAMKKALLEYEKAEKRNLNVFQRSIAQPLMRSFRGQRRGTVCKEAKSMQRETKMAAKGRPKDVHLYLKERTLTTNAVDRIECITRLSPIPLPPSVVTFDRNNCESKELPIPLQSLDKCVLETSFYDDMNGITTSLHEIGLNKIVEIVDNKRENQSPTANSAASHTDDRYFSKTSRNVDERASQNQQSDENKGPNSGRCSKSSDESMNKSVEKSSEKSSPTSLGGRSSDERRSFCRLRQKISYKVNSAGHVPTPPPSGVGPTNRRILGDITQAGGLPRTPLAPNFARPRTIKKAVREHLDKKIVKSDSDRICHMAGNCLSYKIVNQTEDNLTQHTENNLIDSVINSNSVNTVKETKSSPPNLIKCQKSVGSLADDFPTTIDLFPPKMFRTNYDNRVHLLTLSKKKGSLTTESIKVETDGIRKADGRNDKGNSDALFNTKKAHEINPNDVSIIVVSLVDASQLLYHVISQAFAINFGCVELMDADDVIPLVNPMRFDAFQAADLTVIVYSAQDSMSVDNLRRFLRHSWAKFFQQNILFTVLNMNDGSSNRDDATIVDINMSLMKTISPHFVYEINAINMPYELPVVINNILLRDKYFRDGHETLSYRSDQTTNFVHIDDKCRQKNKQKCAII